MLRQWEEGDRHGKLIHKVRKVQVTVPQGDTVAYGDGTNTIPASVFQLRTVEAVSPIVDVDGKLKIMGAPSLDNSALNTFDLTTATDANRGNITAKIGRVDSSNDGVFYFTVRGT
jgi:hypothetical protein